MRFARGQFGGISVCAQLFYREQGTQHRDARSRPPARLDVERIPAGEVAAGSEVQKKEAGGEDSNGSRRSGFVRRAWTRFRAAGIARERGTFHCHTVASDGHNTLEEMAAAAQELGLEYLGIAEHSKSSIQAHGIDALKLRSQISAIRKLNNKLDGFRVFSGVECDILRDGKLDFDDEILGELDFAVASIHSVFNLSEAEMTKRIIRAMENPFITILAHPTGRLLLKREPYAIDIPAVLEAAAETGTWIELNAAPKRLDLDWRWWPLAKEKDVKCVINPDAHRTERLQDLWFGIGIARKGWLTKVDVVNCLPLGKIQSALEAKRNKKA